MEMDAIASPSGVVEVIALAMKDVTSQSDAGVGEMGVVAAEAGMYKRVAVAAPYS